MAALLVIFTFAIFISIDYVLSRREAARAASSAAVPAFTPAVDMDPLAEPVFVAGYELPEPFHYHRGHTWARVLGPDTVAVGLDDFARRLIGRARSLRLPAIGSWIRQGVEAFGVDNGRHTANLLAPVEGKVIAVNEEARRRASVCTDDPYRHGWLVKVQSPGLAANVRNLMSGRLARRWIEDAREQLELRLMALSGSVFQDGGEPSHDFAEHLGDEDWASLVESFLLTKSGHADEPADAVGAR